MLLVTTDTHVRFLSFAFLMNLVLPFAPTNKYLVPSDLPGPGCYDVFNFSYGRQVASSFSLEINDVGPGTPFPDETVIMSFSQITIIKNFYSNDVSNFNVSLYNSDSAGTVPTVEISKANLLVNEGCNNNAPSWFPGAQVCLITVYFPVPYPRIGPIRVFPDKNQYWIVVSFEGQYNPTQVQEFQWPLLCMVRTGASYNPNIPVVAINQDRYDYRVDSASSWLPFRSDYTSGGIYYSLFGPEPSASATKTSSATRSMSAAATSSASLSALASQSAAGTYSATQSATATSTTTSTPSNSLNITAASVTAPENNNTAAIAGSISGVLVGLVCGAACFFLARQYRDGVGLFKNKARYGPKQEKDRSLSAKVENQILKLRGVATPTVVNASKIPDQFDPKSLSSISDAYDMVYGDASSAPVMSPPGAVLVQSSNSQADALAGALSRSGGGETADWATSGQVGVSGRGRVMREKLGFGPQQASTMALKTSGSSTTNNNSETGIVVEGGGGGGEGEGGEASGREPSI